MRFSIASLSLIVANLLLSISCNAMPPKLSDLPSERKTAPYLEQSYATLRALQISAVNYQLAIELSEDNTSFNGDVTIDFKLASRNKMPVTVDFDGGEISSITLNSKPVKWQYNKFFILFAPELFKAGKNKLQINFSHPYATAGDGLHRYKDQETGNVYLYSNFEPFNAHKMFPHFDQPDIKAKFRLSVLAPSAWQVISTTREIKTSLSSDKNPQAEKKQWKFAQTPLMASYVFSLHAGPYKVWEDNTGHIPLRLFARQEVAPYVNYQEWFLFTQQAFAFYNQYFGYSYPFKKYDQLILPDFNSGAMENIGAVTFNENFVGRGKKTYLQRMRHGNVIAHEMAHMWFGDLVTMDWWNGLWLNESFATYMASLQQANNSEFKNDAWDYFYSRNKQWGYTTDQLVTTHPIELAVANTAEAFTNFDGITYGKGAAVLKQLAFYVGEENFQNGVKNYLKIHAHGNTTLKDFMREISSAAKSDLSGWTQEWLHTAGLNTITVDYECSGEGGEGRESIDAKIKHLSIVQTAPDKNATLRTQRVQLGFYTVEKDSIALSKILPLTYHSARTDISAAEGLQCPAFVYPNVNDWGYVKVSLDKKSRQLLMQHINQFDARLRKMLWQNLWDDVLDARMSLTEYIKFAKNNISGESEFTQIGAILDNLGNAKYYFDMMSSAGHDYSAESQEIENIALQQLDRAESGSDFQRVALDLYVSIAYSPSALNNIRDYLLAKNLPKDFVLDQDRRWLLLKRLNQFQFNDYRELTAAEQLKDKSDFGLQMAIICEAIRPDAATKEKWFAELISPNTQYKLATQRLLIKALFPANQNTLRPAFDTRIVSALPELQARNNDRFLSAYAESLVSPHACTADSVNRLSEVRSQYASLSPALNKILSVNVQEEQRCVDMLKIMSAK